MMQLEVVCIESIIFSGKVKMIMVTGVMGELGIYPGHRQLLTVLKPGQIKAVLSCNSNREEVFYISGGILEVQPEIITVLAEVALHARDIDEASAIIVKKEAKQKLSKKQAGIEYSKTMIELAEASAQLRAIQMIRKNRKQYQ